MIFEVVKRKKKMYQQDMRSPQLSRNDVFHSTCIFPVAFKVWTT